MTEIARLQGLMAASQAMIMRAGVRIPGYDRPVPFQYDLRVLDENQTRLQRALDRMSQEQQPGNLGFPFIIVGAGVVGISAIGGWIYKHFTNAKKLDFQARVYDALKKDGVDSARAAELVLGGGTDWNKLVKNLIILSLIGTGLYLYIKLR